MSILIENLIRKILLEDVSEVDGTTELSVTNSNTPSSKSGYDVKLLGTKTFGKGKLRTQHAQKIAKNNGAISAFIITFVKPSKSSIVNDTAILDDIKTICSMGRTVGTGVNAKYNDGKHTFIIVPVKNTNTKKIFHIWIIDSSKYVNIVKQIQDKIENTTPVTGTIITRAKALTKLDQISLMSKDNFETWVSTFKDIANETQTDISSLTFPDFSNVTDIDVPISRELIAAVGYDVKDLGDGRKIITVITPTSQQDKSTSPVKGFTGDILLTSKPGPGGEVIDTYVPYNGTLKFKDETSKEFVTLIGKFKDGLPDIASSIVYAGIQHPNDIKSFDGDIDKTNVIVVGQGSKPSKDDYAELKVFLKSGQAEFNNGKTYNGTWYTDDTTLSMQKQSLKFKTGYISTKDGKELGKYVDGKFSKTSETDKNTLTNLVAVDSITYPYEWQTVGGNVTVYDSGADYIYLFDDNAWYEYPKTKFETELKTVDTDLIFKKILQNDRIIALNEKHGKSAITLEKVKYFTIKSKQVNFYAWDSANNNFVLKIKNMPKTNTNLKSEYIVTNVKTGKISGNKNTYTFYSIGTVSINKQDTELWISSNHIEIKEK